MDDDDFLDPKVKRAVRTVHLRDKDNRGRCGIVGTKDDPQLTTNPERVTCKKCRGRA